MALKDTLIGMGKNLTGNIDTAVLIVDDRRPESAPPAPSDAGASLLGAIQDVASEAANAVNAAAALTGGVSSVNVAQYKKPKYFKVQFNPSELQIDSSVPFEQHLDSQVSGQVRTAVNDASVRPTVTLSVNLYFDQFDKADAFRSTMINPNLNAADLATNVATGIAKLTGKTWSVQPQVEALLAAICNNNTRNVTFCWADFSFIGSLSTADVEYTMFSTSGRPIRATVSLRITQELDPKNLANWDKDFNSAFKGGISSITNSVGNLLNVNL